MAPPPTPSSGYLHTPDLYQDTFVTPDDVTRERSPKGTSNRKDEVTKRSIFFGFELPINTDLGAIGAAVVFDNNGEEGHFSLIPWPSAPVSGAIWGAQDPFKNRHIFIRDPSAPPPTHPEYWPHRIGLDKCHFRLHSWMWLRASAIPTDDYYVDLDRPDADSARTLLRGARTLLAHSSLLSDPLCALESLDALCSAHFSAHDADPHHLGVLHKALKEIQSKIDVVQPDISAALDVLADFLPHLQLVVLGMTEETMKSTPP
ncbi:hypothetical protein PTSG_12779 [Salpingoeca rosetta]|uniref:Uncharacterized protein n=1 Tax=Salpingoeca rosetta (strain ATCC 50818 / BSB-021) TaxID=946362 RepID=F2UKH7_SALR5|nr:uncharacterized protein PTSG_12779 [Salpingoeca rosetta]EGD77626.1 hypothetical protein PTSG_12779 [Salpingoeca rosetta]|eukprot:XP_004990514.1 hypothetical protein PTSG_12779 [Salpingoeca rosetta]